MKTKLIYLFGTLLFAVLLLSCSRDSDSSTSGSYPKNVTIQYKMTSTSTFNNGIIVFTNETGGSSNLTNQTLPFSKTITKTVNKGDNLILGGTLSGNGTVKAEILIDNQVVLTKDFTGNSVVSVNLTHYFQ